MRGKRRILVIDDDEMMRSLYPDILEGYEIIPAKSSEEGLRLALNNNISLIILDILMPGMSGLELISEYNKRIPKSNRARVVVVTGSGNIRESDIKSYGIDALFYKPFKNDELVKCVSKYVH